MTCSDWSEVDTFFVTYTQQVECLLNIIRACRQGDWEEYLAAHDKQIKYFFTHDLYNYARLMPSHLAQMNELQTQSPETWKALKEGDFCVKVPTSIFVSYWCNLKSILPTNRNHCTTHLSTHTHEEADTQIPLKCPWCHSTDHIDKRHLCMVPRHRCLPVAHKPCCNLHSTR